MLRNYFKIAWRNLRQNRLLSGINILGLSTGIACCLLIAMYVLAIKAAMANPVKSLRTE